MAHLSLSVGMIADIFEQMAEAVMEVRAELSIYSSDHHEFNAVGDRMKDIWQQGVDCYCKRAVEK